MSLPEKPSSHQRKPSRETIGSLNVQKGGLKVPINEVLLNQDSNCELEYVPSFKRGNFIEFPSEVPSPRSLNSDDDGENEENNSTKSKIKF